MERREEEIVSPQMKTFYEVLSLLLLWQNSVKGSLSFNWRIVADNLNEALEKIAGLQLPSIVQTAWWQTIAVTKFYISRNLKALGFPVPMPFQTFTDFENLWELSVTLRDPRNFEYVFVRWESPSITRYLSYEDIRAISGLDTVDLDAKSADLIINPAPLHLDRWVDRDRLVRIIWDLQKIDTFYSNIRESHPLFYDESIHQHIISDLQKLRDLLFDMFIAQAHKSLSFGKLVSGSHDRFKESTIQYFRLFKECWVFSADMSSHYQLEISSLLTWILLFQSSSLAFFFSLLIGLERFVDTNLFDSIVSELKDSLTTDHDVKWEDVARIKIDDAMANLGETPSLQGTLTTLNMVSSSLRAESSFMGRSVEWNNDLRALLDSTTTQIQRDYEEVQEGVIAILRNFHGNQSLRWRIQDLDIAYDDLRDLISFGDFVPNQLLDYMSEDRHFSSAVFQRYLLSCIGSVSVPNALRALFDRLAKYGSAGLISQLGDIYRTEFSERFTIELNVILLKKFQSLGNTLQRMHTRNGDNVYALRTA